MVAGFGFVKLLENIGVDRRVSTAGDRKVLLDPFQPEKSADVDHVKQLHKEAGGRRVVSAGGGRRGRQ